jgi:hypothetical protein
MTTIIHDAAGACEPEYHRLLPDWKRCRCGEYQVCGARLEVTVGNTTNSLRCCKAVHDLREEHEAPRGSTWRTRERGHGQCGCCDSISYLESILVQLHKDGPEHIGQAEYDLVCKLIDDLGK